MPHWYWEKKELRLTPSQQSGMMDFDVEMRHRREGVRFILELGKALNLSHTTMASGGVYFHRFYMFHSFIDFPKYVVATCCLFLAGKAEETPKKCRDLIRTVRALTNDRQFTTFGADPKEEVMVLERVLLQTIKFDLQVDHPYCSLIKYAKCLKGDKAKLQKMVQMSWTFVNDSLCTTLCLQWEPEIVAIALMYLAAKLSKFEVRDWENRKESHKHWWDQYVTDLDVEVLEDICHQVLDLYAQPHTPAKEQAESPPPQRVKSPKPKSPPPPQPPSKSRPHTPPPPPQPPQPPSHPAVNIPTAAVGAPAVFQQQQYPTYAAAAAAPPLPPVAAAGVFQQHHHHHHQPPLPPQQQVYYPAAAPLPMAAAPLPPAPLQRYHQQQQIPPQGYPYPLPPPQQQNAAAYYNQPPPPPPPPSGTSYHRGGRY